MSSPFMRFGLPGRRMPHTVCRRAAGQQAVFSQQVIADHRIGRTARRRRRHDPSFFFRLGFFRAFPIASLSSSNFSSVSSGAPSKSSRSAVYRSSLSMWSTLLPSGCRSIRACPEILPAPPEGGVLAQRSRRRLGVQAGGHQVLKKWLSYRERKVLDLPLIIDEIQHFTAAAAARRIAAVHDEADQSAARRHPPA